MLYILVFIFGAFTGIAFMFVLAASIDAKTEKRKNEELAHHEYMRTPNEVLNTPKEFRDDDAKRRLEERLNGVADKINAINREIYGEDCSVTFSFVDPCDNRTPKERAFDDMIEKALGWDDVEHIDTIDDWSEEDE